MTILRIMGTNSFIKGTQNYMDELESIILTTDPMEAILYDDKNPLIDVEINEIAELVNREYNTYLEIITIR